MDTARVHTRRWRLKVAEGGGSTLRRVKCDKVIDGVVVCALFQKYMGLVTNAAEATSKDDGAGREESVENCPAQRNRQRINGARDISVPEPEDSAQASAAKFPEANEGLGEI